MFCPECRAEYREGFETCADCEIPLVESLPEAGDAGELVPLRQVWQPESLPVIVSLLESHGIPHRVQGEYVHSTVALAHLHRAADPTSVCWMILVPEACLEKARDLLAAEMVADEEEHADEE